MSGFGTGRSRQLAFEHTDADVLVFADADMYVEPDVIAELTDLYRGGFSGAVHAEISFTEMTAPELLALARHENDGLSTALRRRQLPGQQWRERHWAASADYSHPVSSSYRATVGAFLAIDRSSYLATGGFRDIPVRGVEDIEFGYRLQASGCHQRVWRSGGIWHLGERTFATQIDAAEEDARNEYLSAYVPIWARTLHERRAVLAAWRGEIVPFIGLAESRMIDDLNGEFGRDTACELDDSTPAMSAPFARAEILSPSHAARAVETAYKAFRSRRGGEVVVMAAGRPVMNLHALWALELAARRAAGPIPTADEPLTPDRVEELTRSIRRDLGVIVVSVE